MKILFIDGYNMLHRSRYGMVDGQYNIIYTFFRSLRALTEKINPDKIIFVLEGYPKSRFDLYPEYKANRKINDNDVEKINSYNDFKKQKDIILNLLAHLPIDILKHPDVEGDDLIGELVNSVYKKDECIIATGDTDFYQLLVNENVKIFNPIKKEFVSCVADSYLKQKCLLGDNSDNISGIPRVGVKTAEKLLKLSELDFNKWLNEDIKRREIFERNMKLIKFMSANLSLIENLRKNVDYEKIKNEFIKMKFNSFITQNSWDKFVKTFDNCI